MYWIVRVCLCACVDCILVCLRIGSHRLTVADPVRLLIYTVWWGKVGAVKLYEGLGFERIAPYCECPEADHVCMNLFRKKG